MSTARETIDALLARSNELGADPTTTNYAGGNTSAKGTDTDPVTGQDVELLWVKGSGGDLGTLLYDTAKFLKDNQEVDAADDPEVYQKALYKDAAQAAADMTGE